MSIELILYITLLVSIGFQISYLLPLLFSFSRIADPSQTQVERIVTVIIPCYRDYDILLTNLPYILSQNYKKYRVLIVFDGNDGLDLTYINKLAEEYDHLSYILNEENVGKKCAISRAIKEVSDELLLFTDADCRPDSSEWIRDMVACYSSNSAVIGYGPYRKNSGFLNKWIRYETFQTAFQYLSSAQMGLPYMAVGRNLLYHKSMFDEIGGYESHAHILSGDDDLFIQELSQNGYHITPITAPSTHMTSTPPTSWNSYWNQKSRHVSTARSYTQFAKIMLILIPFFYLLYYLSFISLLVHALVDNLSIMWIVGIALLRWILMIGIYSFPMKRLNERDLIIFVPLLDIFAGIYYLRLLPSIINKKTDKW